MGARLVSILMPTQCPARDSAGQAGLCPLPVLGILVPPTLVAWKLSSRCLCASPCLPSILLQGLFQHPLALEPPIFSMLG